MTLFGRPLRDHLPNHKLQLREEWVQIANKREEALAKHHVYDIDDNRHGRELIPLNTGDSVQIQNQTGNHPNCWHSTGIISEVLPHRQYQVVVDGSRRITRRNRKFLRNIEPICRRITPDVFPPSTPTSETPVPPPPPRCWST